jgi:glycosyltransferase involved in cell wall biosynthesis
VKEIRKQKTIAIVMENISYGGATTHLINLINSEKFHNFKFLIITNKNNNAKNQILKLSNKKLINLLTYTPFNIISTNSYILKSFFLILRPLFFFFSVFQMLILIKSNKFDILIGNCGGYGNFRTEMAAIIAGRILKKKLFLLIHHNYTKPLIWINLINLINIFLGKFLHGIIFVSHATKLSIKKNTNLLKYFQRKSIVIHNGVELKKIKKENINYFKSNKKIIKIGMLSRIERYKGQEDLIKAFNIMPENLKSRFKIFFIGTGKKEYISQINNEIEKLKIKKYFKFLNYLDIDSLSIIKNFDLIISLTRDFEAFGYSIAESLYAGVPVISTKVGGVGEYLNNNNSILIKPGDINALKKELIKFSYSKNNNLRNKRIKNGKALITKRFNSEIMAKKYLKYFLHIH